jgi:hypothetical protein
VTPNNAPTPILAPRTLISSKLVWLGGSVFELGLPDTGVGRAGELNSLEDIVVEGVAAPPSSGPTPRSKFTNPVEPKRPTEMSKRLFGVANSELAPVAEGPEIATFPEPGIEGVEVTAAPPPRSGSSPKLTPKSSLEVGPSARLMSRRSV